jgi:hypothetical protein
MHQKLLALLITFEWDTGNYHKSWRKHNVSAKEAEEIFNNEPFMMFDDLKHSRHEKRYHALGTTNAGRKLIVSFTVRNHQVRVISTRTMNEKERKIYGQKQN